MKKRALSILLGMVLLAVQVFPALNARAQEAEAMQAPETAHCCGTDPELLQELNTALLQKRGLDIQGKALGYSLDWNIPDRFGTLTPSTGEVKFLVLPIAYPDYPEMKAAYSEQELYDKYFAEYDPSLEMRKQSLRAYYYKTSCGKLNFTGGVLPVYTAPKESTYYAKAPASENPQNDLIKDALSYYVSQGYDLSDYDGDGDGEVDAFSVKYLLPKNDRGEDWYYWNAKIWAQNYTELNGIKVTRYLFSGIQDHVSTDEHETGHLMGLIDNYKTTGACVIDNGLEDMMSCTGYYFCAYHKYLLGWIDPVVLTNENDIAKMDSLDLYAVESCDANSGDKPQAVILIPEPDMLPFTEYFILEYRNGTFPTMYSDPVFKGNPGVVIWHCNTFLRPPKYLSYKNRTDYIETVKRVGATEIYEIEDAYREGDIFSSDGEGANSNFKNSEYTGAYMEVLDLDADKATLKVGFREPDLSPPPTIVFSEPLPKATKGILYRKDDVIIETSVMYNSELIPEESTDVYSLMGSLSVTGLEYKLNRVSCKIKGNPKETYIDLEDDPEGSYQLTAGVGAATYRGKRSREAISEVFYVDRTPPEVVLSGAAPQTVERGEAYTELGAKVTDNLDPDIIAGKLDGKLVIDNSQVDTGTIGTYTVTYTATDHAGNETAVEREVIVQDTIAPTASVAYSTTQPTSGDVVATITPSEDVTVTNTEGGSLSYTFTENGSFTFEFEDEAGNKGTATATVSNIDKSLPTGTVSYDITDPTNQDVTATLMAVPGITILNNGGSSTHVFTENGSFEFQIQNAAGTKGTVAATVNWIDKEAPTATVSYSSHKLTNQDVIAAITPSEDVTVTNNSGSLSYTFTENGSFTFEFEDEAGNKGSVTAAVDWIDKEAPAATVEYSTTSPTNEDVTAIITPSEDVTVTDAGGSLGHTFTENGSYTFTFVDSAGNTGSVTATVDWIDREAPVITLDGDNPQSIQKGDPYIELGASVTDNADQEIQNKLAIDASRVNTEAAGEYPVTYNVTDEAGNKAETKIRIVKVVETTPLPTNPSKPIKPSPQEPSACPKDGTCPLSQFTDTNLSAWYHDGVHYVLENGFMESYGNGRFGPNETLSRAQLVQILYNKEGAPDVTEDSKFTDVKSGQWYTSAVTWAVENDIVSGYGNGEFGPNDPVTREQLAVILWRRAGRPDTSGTLNSFTDRDKVGNYAATALKWAVEKKILFGKGGGILDPKGKSTRAEAAAILQRLPQ